MELPETEQHPHVVRVGWSVAETDMTVGESKYSLGYGATGKRVNEGRYENYGEPFGIGDVIGCFIVSTFPCVIASDGAVKDLLVSFGILLTELL